MAGRASIASVEAAVLGPASAAHVNGVGRAGRIMAAMAAGAPEHLLGIGVASSLQSGGPTDCNPVIAAFSCANAVTGIGSRTRTIAG